jgi:hypothetical protein
VYDVTGFDEYIKNDYNAFVVKMDNEEEVVEKINILKENEYILEKLQKGAIETARKWPDWEYSSSNFEICLDEIIKQKTILNNKNSISFKINHFKEWYHYCNKNIPNKKIENIFNNKYIVKAGKIILPNKRIRLFVRRKIEDIFYRFHRNRPIIPPSQT